MLILPYKATSPHNPNPFAFSSSSSPHFGRSPLFSGCDILWAGVPLLAFPTLTMSGRVAASLLHAALPLPAAATLIARSLDGRTPMIPLPSCRSAFIL